MKILFVIFTFVIFSNNLFSQELNRYSCIVDRINIEGMEEKRNYDEKGIIVANNRYHPLLIAQYGTISYYYFLETQDSSYYYKCVNQVNYFKDTLKVNIILNGRGIGLPYTFNFWDLKAPWYSGMTQGYAISYLLRYYILTQDSSVLPIIEKIAYVLITPQEKGGTISKTKEGYTWIEEYPNSKKSPQVLNGFINGLIGLKEYCDFFSKDTTALRILNETYFGLRNSFKYYDTPVSTTYNRKRKPISNKYLRYQIYQMKHLNEIFNDTIFDNQMRIWSVLAYNKFITEKSNSYKFRNHNIAQPNKEKTGRFIELYLKKFLLDTTMNPSAQLVFGNKNLKRVINNKKPRTSRKKPKELYVLLKPFANDTINCLNFLFNGNVENIDITIYKLPKRKKDKLIELNNYKLIKDNQLFLSFDEQKLPDLLIKMGYGFDSIPEIENLKVYNTNNTKPPWFIYHISKAYELKEGINYKFEIPVINSKRDVVFYKYAKDNNRIRKSIWEAQRTVHEKFIPEKDGTYQFMVVANYSSPLSTIGTFKIEQVKLEEEVK